LVIQSERRWYQVGVASAKFEPIQTVEFVRVATFVDWIMEVISEKLEMK
jgi:hypothetical protein